MRWSYADLMATPQPILDELVLWLAEQAEEDARRMRDLERLRARR